MEGSKLYFMNAAVLPNPGTYIFNEIYEDEARTYWESYQEKICAIGHQGTVDFLKAIGYAVEYNRVKVEMQKGDHALVFKILDRLPEGKVLNTEEMKNYKFQFYLLRRIV